MDGPAIYRIEVQGELNPGWSDRLGGMRMTIRRSAEKDRVTRLEGLLPDQAALAGVLNALFDLHIPVLAVECMDSQKT